MLIDTECLMDYPLYDNVTHECGYVNDITPELRAENHEST